MKTDKELKVIQAAHDVFFRYGFARTTMGDLAKEAGLSRPALYLVYPGKAEVFQAVVEWMIDTMLDTIVSTLKPDWSLERRLTHVLETSVCKGYDEVKAHPDAQDLLSLDGQMPGLEHAYEKLHRCLADQLDDTVKASGSTATADEIARTLMSAVRGFKLVAIDGADLRKLIALQVALVSAALQK